MTDARWILPNAMVILAMLHAASAQAMPDNSAVRYQVKRGDSLYALAQAYCLHPGDYAAVQKLNHVVHAKRLPVGVTLMIPRSLLRFESSTARVLSFRGDVRIFHAASNARAAVGLEVREGDTIVTNVNSFITLALADGTSVSLPSQSRLRLDRLRHVLLTNTMDRNFSILAGQADSSVHALSQPDDRFRFSTPNSVSTVRGTQLRVSYDPSSAKSRTEVIEGKVEVTSPVGATTRMLPAGFGTVAQDGAIGEVQALLPAPALTRPERDQDEPQLHFVLAPVSGAKAYRTEVAADAGFLDIMADTTSGEESLLPALDDGNWFVRVSAIDASGLQGPGKIYSFRRRLNSTDLSPAERREGVRDAYLFRWQSTGAGRFQFRFQLFTKHDPDHPLVDEPGLHAQDFTLTSLAAGDYQWRVETMQFLNGQVYEKWSANQEFTVTKR